MGVSLPRGGGVSPSTPLPGPAVVRLGLGWDVGDPAGVEVDLDLSAICLGADGRAVSDRYFVFFNNLATPEGAVVHRGDNPTGEGDGDDEVIEVGLAELPAAVERVVFVVSIYDAEGRGQDFGSVRGAVVRVCHAGVEIARDDLTGYAPGDTATVVGEAYRDGAGWTFRTVGRGQRGGLAGVARGYGVHV